MRVVSGMAPGPWPFLWGRAGSWGLLAPHGVSSGLSFLICKMAMKHPLRGGGGAEGGRKDLLGDCVPKHSPGSGVL